MRSSMKIFSSEAKCRVSRVSSRCISSSWRRSDRLAEHRAYREEMRLLVLDDAAVGRDVHFAIRKGIKGVQRLVRRGSGGEVYQYFHLVGGIVVYLAHLDFPFFYGFQYRVDERRCGFPVGNFADAECLVVYFRYLGTYAHHSAPLAVVVATSTAPPVWKSG